MPELGRPLSEGLGQRTLRVYQLPQECVRLDSTTVSLYHEPEGSELIRYGHSKDHRPDLAQLKVMLATLDPSGSTVGDPDWWRGSGPMTDFTMPAVDEARAGAWEKRVCSTSGTARWKPSLPEPTLPTGGDYYLTPLSLKGGAS
jgi:hypothetical protein